MTCGRASPTRSGTPLWRPCSHRPLRKRTRRCCADTARRCPLLALQQTSTSEPRERRKGRRNMPITGDATQDDIDAAILNMLRSGTEVRLTAEQAARLLEIVESPKPKVPAKAAKAKA